jgi:hypothetical protein
MDWVGVCDKTVKYDTKKRNASIGDFKITI